jgi:hypothetical protein
MHIGMNMMSYHSSGSDIEKVPSPGRARGVRCDTCRARVDACTDAECAQALGSIRYFVLIMLLIFVPAALYAALLSVLAC